MTHSPADGRIVVGVDGSAASDAAVRWAVREARLRHATVHLVSAYHSDSRHRPQYVPPSSWVTPHEEGCAAGTLLAAAMDVARRCVPAGRLTGEVANEPPAQVLLDRSAHAALLVLGTTRPGAPAWAAAAGHGAGGAPLPAAGALPCRGRLAR